MKTILTHLVSKIFSTYFYDTKVIQTLYSTSHKLMGLTYGIIFILQDILNLFSCVHIKKCSSFLIRFWVDYFFCLLYLANILKKLWKKKIYIYFLWFFKVQWVQENQGVTFLGWGCPNGSCMFIAWSNQIKLVEVVFE